MATEPTSLSRQPTKLDYASPTQFRFLINQLPKVEYFTTEANIPGITLGEGTYATPLKDTASALANSAADLLDAADQEAANMLNGEYEYDDEEDEYELRG